MSTPTRTEKDSLGTFQVPADALYGVQTARALANFPISGRRPDPDFVAATVRVKRAAAAANHACGSLDDRRADAIREACDQVLGGAYTDQFVVDRFQAGAGTSHNMNANEVLANLANLGLGGECGVYDPVHPNDHVNQSQSTNDTIPTAIRLAALAKLPRLAEAVREMAGALEAFADRERETIKSGRTHLQDAVPTTLGRELAAYAWTLREQVERLEEAAKSLHRIGLGGTAAGTGLNAPPGYRERAAEELSRLMGRPITPHPDMAAAMQSMADLAQFSGQIAALAGELTRISNDIRLLSSGPRTGLAEVQLPAVQPGSSIMPGKVNPVMFEMLNQTLYQVLGQDHAIQAMNRAGQMELNVMMPALGSALFDAMEWLTASVSAATERGVRGMTANRERNREYALASVGLATLLNRAIGYEKAAEVAKESERTGIPVGELVAEHGLLSREQFERMVEEAAKNGRVDF
ncbi:aspartate ammonia-lyase [Thiohalorhabdus methylotrophus]|uniref:Aspartate ammonia-lyase n=1 Tax=Thiohalorhabdus methylotrophus TaxID=3242694 RepID=A0ABV4TX52_9GAMM